MDAKHLDRLDAVAEAIREGAEQTGYHVLSTGEKLYVALAANSAGLLKMERISIAGALDRIGPDLVAALVARWAHR